MQPPLRRLHSGSRLGCDLQVLHSAVSLLRLRRLKIATNGKAAGVIANCKSLKTKVGEYEGKLRPHWFLTSWSMPFHLTIGEVKFFVCNSGEPSRTRTCDPLVKSQLLYQLSYRPIHAESTLGRALSIARNSRRILHN